MSPAEQIATEILAVINRSPRTPTKAQLVDTISVMLDVVKDDEPFSVPLGTVVQPQRPGAFVAVQGDMSLLVDGWTISSSRELTTHEAALAILDWIRKGVLLAPRKT